jgi:hypothetical protein
MYEVECEYWVQDTIGRGTYGYCNKVIKRYPDKTIEPTTNNNLVKSKKGDEGKVYCIKAFKLSHSKTVDAKMKKAA